MGKPFVATVDVVLFQLPVGRYAMLAESVAEMTPLDDPDKSERLVWLHELLSIDLDQESYCAPCILKLFQPAPLSGLVINQLASHILHLAIDHIRPLPPAIQHIVQPTAIWATFLDGNDIVFLIDPHRIVNHVRMVIDRRKRS